MTDHPTHLACLASNNYLWRNRQYVQVLRDTSEVMCHTLSSLSASNCHVHCRSNEAVGKAALGTDQAAATEHPQEQQRADDVEPEQDTDRQLPVNTLFYGVPGQQVSL